MKKALGGGLALALAAAGGVLMAGPGSAQEADLRLSVHPTLARPGEEIVIQSVDPCLFDGDAGFVDIFVTPPSGEQHLFGPPLFLANENGSWSSTLPGNLENLSEMGTYTVAVVCDADEDPENGNDQFYADATFTIEATPTTEAQAPAPDATAAPAPAGRPHFSG